MQLTAEQKAALQEKIAQCEAARDGLLAQANQAEGAANAYRALIAESEKAATEQQGSIDAGVQQRLAEALKRAGELEGSNATERSE